MAKKPAAPKKQKSFDQNLWDTADKLRGSVESSEHKRLCGHGGILHHEERLFSPWIVALVVYPETSQAGWYFDQDWYGVALGGEEQQIS